ncbi:unnamed protein product [Discosporangium mesarthrocarpum]
MALDVAAPSRSPLGEDEQFWGCCYSVKILHTAWSHGHAPPGPMGMRTHEQRRRAPAGVERLRKKKGQLRQASKLEAMVPPPRNNTANASDPWSGCVGIVVAAAFLTRLLSTVGLGVLEVGPARLYRRWLRSSSHPVLTGDVP